VLYKVEYECAVCKYSWDPDVYKKDVGCKKDLAAPSHPDTAMREPATPVTEARRQLLNR
jgi:hypothetical protein